MNCAGFLQENGMMLTWAEWQTVVFFCFFHYLPRLEALPGILVCVVEVRQFEVRLILRTFPIFDT
jgi:hypothetical protein